MVGAEVIKVVNNINTEQSFCNFLIFLNGGFVIILASLLLHP